MPDLDGNRNSAIQTWISTFPVEQRLSDFLSTIPASIRADVEQSARDVLKATDSYLAAEADKRAIEAGTFHRNLHAYLSAHFAWATSETISTLQSYTSWMIWHEGYAS